MRASASPKNKTITLGEHEARRLESKLLTLRGPVRLEQALNLTILGDALAVIDNLPRHFVDLLFVAPPYNRNKVFGQARFKKMSSGDYEAWLRSWLAKIVQRLKPGASIYVCGDWRSSAALFRVLSEFFEIRNRITWEREKGRGAKTHRKNTA